MHQAESLSIIGWVIRQMPLSVRRKRLASSSGSSPTTRPSGISHAAIDDDRFRTAVAADIHIGQHDRLLHAASRN